MSELYREQIDESLTMAFSRFDEKLAFLSSLDDFENLKQPIESAVEKMIFILKNHQNGIRRFLAEMLNESSHKMLENLKIKIRRNWNERIRNQ